MALYRSQMVAYARQQCAAAQQILATHVPEGAGCCAACGRATPCPARVEAQHLQTRYAPWLSADPEPAVSEHRFATPDLLVRPYVRNRARG
jgi:hypothetical protein